jgi:hypothetical protein
VLVPLGRATWVEGRAGRPVSPERAMLPRRRREVRQRPTLESADRARQGPVPPRRLVPARRPSRKVRRPPPQSSPRRALHGQQVAAADRGQPGTVIWAARAGHAHDLLRRRLAVLCGSEPNLEVVPVLRVISVHERSTRQLLHCSKQHQLPATLVSATGVMSTRALRHWLSRSRRMTAPPA